MEIPDGQGRLSTLLLDGVKWNTDAFFSFQKYENNNQKIVKYKMKKKKNWKRRKWEFENFSALCTQEMIGSANFLLSNSNKYSLHQKKIRKFHQTFSAENSIQMSNIFLPQLKFRTKSHCLLILYCLIVSIKVPLISFALTWYAYLKETREFKLVHHDFDKMTWLWALTILWRHNLGIFVKIIATLCNESHS